MELNKKRTISGNYEYDARSVELITILDCWLTLREELADALQYGDCALAESACNALMLKHWNLMEAQCPDPEMCSMHTLLSGADYHFWRYRSYKNASSRPYYYKSGALNKMKQPDMRRCPGSFRRTSSYMDF